MRCVLGLVGDSYYYYSCLVLCWCRGVSLLVLAATTAAAAAELESSVSLLHLASRHGTPSQHDLLLHRCAIGRLCLFCVCLSKGSQQPKPSKPYMRAGVATLEGRKEGATNLPCLLLLAYTLTHDRHDSTSPTSLDYSLQYHRLSLSSHGTIQLPRLAPIWQSATFIPVPTSPSRQVAAAC